MSEPYFVILGPMVEGATSNTVVNVVPSNALVAALRTGLKSKESRKENILFALIEVYDGIVS